MVRGYQLKVSLNNRNEIYFIESCLFSSSLLKIRLFLEYQQTSLYCPAKFRMFISPKQITINDITISIIVISGNFSMISKKEVLNIRRTKKDD